MQVILSNNGYVWIAPQSTEEVETGGYIENLQVIRILLHYIQPQFFNIKRKMFFLFNAEKD